MTPALKTPFVWTIQPDGSLFAEANGRRCGRAICIAKGCYVAYILPSERKLGYRTSLLGTQELIEDSVEKSA